VEPYPICLHGTNTDTLACAVTNYCEYLVKFTKVTVVVVDSAAIKVMPSTFEYLRSSHSSVGVKKYLREAMTPHLYMILLKVTTHLTVVNVTSSVG
jgi:hypothetical protein